MHSLRYFLLPLFAMSLPLKAESSLEQELAQLSSAHAKAAAAAVRSADDFYKQTLNALLKRASTAGDQEAKIAVEAALERLKQQRGFSLDLPQTEAELEKFLPGTTWTPSAEPDNPYTVNKHERFVGRDAQPTYKVTGRRTLTMFWGPTTHIPCILTEDCSLMIEQAGMRQTFLRTQRPATLTLPSAQINVAHMKATPLIAGDGKEGWSRVPTLLAKRKAVIFMPTAPTNGVADITVQADGLLLVACNYDYQGNSSGEWDTMLWDQTKFQKEGWKLLTEAELGGQLIKADNRAQVVFMKQVKKGATLQLRCNKHDPPFPILLQ